MSIEKNGKVIEKQGVPPAGIQKNSSLDEQARRNSLLKKVREKENKAGVSGKKGNR